jgi:hypothetical protein
LAADTSNTTNRDIPDLKDVLDNKDGYKGSDAKAKI